MDVQESVRVSTPPPPPPHPGPHTPALPEEPLAGSAAGTVTDLQPPKCPPGDLAEKNLISSDGDSPSHVTAGIAFVPSC